MIKISKKYKMIIKLKIPLHYFDTAQEFGIFETIAVIVFLLPFLAVGARRLHDINRSGWWQLLFLFFIVGFMLDDEFSSYLDAGQEWGTFETISYLTFITLIVAQEAWILEEV